MLSDREKEEVNGVAFVHRVRGSGRAYDLAIVRTENMPHRINPNGRLQTEVRPPVGTIGAGSSQTTTGAEGKQSAGQQADF